MGVKITFKSGKYATISKFETVSYPGYDETITLTEDKLNEFHLSNESTYIFSGSQTVIAKGSDIDFIEFD